MSFYEFPNSNCYNQNIEWLIANVRKLIENYKDFLNLPELVQKLIEQYLESGEFDEYLNEQLSEFILNVKFPPNGLPPAKGDGTTDDTITIQGTIDYANSLGGRTIFFPTGSYLTGSLTLYDKCSLFGFDRYSTRLVAKGGLNAPLITIASGSVSLTGLELNGNAGIQTNQLPLASLVCDSFLMNDMLLTNSESLLILNVKKSAQISEVVFGSATTFSLKVTGTGYVDADNITFESLSSVSGQHYIEIDVNKSLFTDIRFVGVSPLGAKITGSNNVIGMWQGNVVEAYDDMGEGNSVNVYSTSRKEVLTGDVKLDAKNYTENISGDKVFNVGDLTENSKNRTMAIEEKYTLSAKGIEVNSIDIGSIINYNYKHYLIAIEPDLTSVFNNVTDNTLILLSPDVVYTVGTCTINSSNVCIMGASNVKKAVINLTGNISVLGIESGVFKDGFSIINVELNGNNRAFDFIIKFRNRSVISSCNFINFNHCLHIEQSNIISIDRSLFRYSNYGLYAPKSAVGESYSNEILVVNSSFNDNYNTCCFAYGGGTGTKHTFRNCTFEIAQGESDIYKFDYENVTLVLDGAYIEDNYYTVRTNGIYVHNGSTLWFVNSNVNNILQVIKCTDSYAHVYNNKIINCTRVAEITNGGPYTFHSNGNYFYGMEVPYLNHSDFNNVIGSSYLPNIGTNIPIYKTTIGESKQQIFTYPYLGNGYISLVIGANKQAVCPIIPVPDLPNSLSIDMSVFEVGDVVYIYLIEIKLNHVILGEKSPFVF